MHYLALDKLTERSDHSIYKLVNLAARRSLEIADGQPKLVDMDSSLKPSTIALYEIAAGRVSLKKENKK